MGIVSEQTKYERILQLLRKKVEFFFCSNVGVVLVR